MRRTRELEALAAQITHRTNRLFALAGATLARADPEAYRTVSYVTVEALSAWSTFSREYYLSCAYLSPKTVSGAVIQHGQSSITDELTAVVSALRSLNPGYQLPRSGRVDPRQEPDWKRKDVLLRLFNNLSFSNATSVASALSYPTTFFDQLPSLRNFFAHRDRRTAGKVRSLAYRNYGLARVRHPVDFVNDVLPNRSDSLLREWIADIQTIAVELCA